MPDFTLNYQGTISLLRSVNKTTTEISEPHWAKLARRRWQYHQKKETA